MNSDILNTEIQDFISDNLNTEPTSLVLRGSPFPHISIQKLVEQIEAKQKCKSKLPIWYAAKNIYYPNKLNIEQTSSEITAAYKSELVSGKSLIDITGGFGVDTYYFSKQIDEVVHCEINTELSEIVSHNNNQLQISNVETIALNGIDYLRSNNKNYNWIYIDPSRRHNSKGKVFMLKDCIPNVPEHLNTFFTYADNILIKTSPLLDISLGLKELTGVKEIQIVAVNNEVKELLWLLRKGYDNDIRITAANIKKDSKDVFSFLRHHEAAAKIELSQPLTYLYEPNAAILKSGGFNSVATDLGLTKIHMHSHLYTSNQRVAFPGRCFKIETVYSFSKKEMKALTKSQANITTRNFPESVKDIRRKYKIKDGGSNYLFFTTDHQNNRIIIKCTKPN